MPDWGAHVCGPLGWYALESQVLRVPDRNHAPAVAFEVELTTKGDAFEWEREQRTLVKLASVDNRPLKHDENTPRGRDTHPLNFIAGSVHVRERKAPRFNDHADEHPTRVGASRRVPEPWDNRHLLRPFHGSGPLRCSIHARLESSRLSRGLPQAVALRPRREGNRWRGPKVRPYG